MFLFVISYNETYTDEEIQKLFKPLTHTYGFSIVYKIEEDFLSTLEISPYGFPAGPPRSSVVKPIKQYNLVRYPILLRKALSKYPVKVIDQYLEGIYFAKEINNNGFKYGGSYDIYRRVMYLVNDDYSEELSIYAFHHEFSSLLLRSHSFHLNPWEDQNPPSFKYLYDIYGSTKNTMKHVSFDVEPTEKEYKDGVMSFYGRTEFENDFNEYSAMIFTYPEKTKKLMETYPRIRAKFLVWLKFYQSIDPIFTEEYLFEDL
ncbi:MAG: hypothetical protein GY737_19885 [Desulfobacteraceae bacterium]|nr:hypothetical protein [Desulfobacteraceae bacterium]